MHLAPEDVQLRVELASALFKAMDLAGVEVQLAEALRLDANNADAHNLRGVLLAQRNDVASAIQEFELALEVQPDHAKAKANLARVRQLNPPTKTP